MNIHTEALEEIAPSAVIQELLQHVVRRGQSIATWRDGTVSYLKAYC